MNKQGCRIIGGFILLALLLAGVGIYLRAKHVASKPTVFHTYARLILQQPPEAEWSLDFGAIENILGTAMEVFRSGELRSRATERVRKLKPELTMTPVSMRLDRAQNSSMINIQVGGTEPEYIVAYLNAMLDEFISLRHEMAGMQSDSQLAVPTEELLRLEKDMVKKEVELKALQTEQSPTIRKAELDALAKSLVTLNERKLAGEGVVDEEIAEMKARILKIEGEGHKVEAIKAELERLQSRYDKMLTALEDLDIASSTERIKISIMDRASSAIPLEPSRF